MRTALLIPLVATAALLTGCGQSDPAPESPVDQAVSAPLEAPTVRLLSAGEGEKRVINYQDDSSEQQSTIAISDGFNQGTAPSNELSSDPGEQPQLNTYTADYAVKSSGSHARDIRFELSNPQYSDQSHSAEAAETAGFQMGWTAEPTGRVLDIRLAPPKNSSATSRELAELYLKKLTAQPIIFPSEPIATGAQWTVENRVTGNSNMLRHTTYTLEKSEGDSVRLTAVVNERLTIGALSLADEGQPGELKVTSTSSTSHGSFDIDLKKPLPTQGELAVDTRVIYGGEEGKVAVFQDFASKLKFS